MKAILVTCLNFILPGSGLLVLRRTYDAIINLIIAVLVPLLWMLTPGGTESIHYAMLAVAAGSAGYAHAMATRQLEGA